MTHKVIHTGNPPYLANLVQWHTPCRTIRSAFADILSVTRCNTSFDARSFRSVAPAIWNSLSSNVRSCETHNILLTSEISYFPLSLVTHLSASDTFSTMALYKSIYVLIASTLLLAIFRSLLKTHLHLLTALHDFTALLLCPRSDIVIAQTLIIFVTYLLKVLLHFCYFRWSLMTLEIVFAGP